MAFEGKNNRDNADKEQRNAKRNRPKKVSEAYLERAALHYLGRFNSSEHNLRQVLERKVRRRNEENAPASDDQKAWIDAVASKCVKYGYVDDAVYARQRAQSFLRRGKPTGTIAQDLRHKGIATDLIAQVLAELETDEDASADARAAAAYVRRRRFGSFRRKENIPEDKLDKELAAMMRAGFRYDLARSMLALSEDEIIALLA